MLDITDDIEAAADSKRNTVRLIQQPKEAGEPIVLTVNGSAELVVQDATSFQKLIELVDRIETLEAIREGLTDEADGRLISLEDVKELVRRKHGISL